MDIIISHGVSLVRTRKRRKAAKPAGQSYDDFLSVERKSVGKREPETVCNEVQGSFFQLQLLVNVAHSNLHLLLMKTVGEVEKAMAYRKQQSSKGYFDARTPAGTSARPSIMAPRLGVK